MNRIELLEVAANVTGGTMARNMTLADSEYPLASTWAIEP